MWTTSDDVISADEDMDILVFSVLMRTRMWTISDDVIHADEDINMDI